MPFDIDDLALLYPDRVFLDFSQAEKDQCWLETANHTNLNASGRWQMYLNRLVAAVFARYIVEEPDLKEKPRCWHQEQDQVNLLQWVNGTALDLGSTRLVLIPSDEDELDELRVPEEWVELADWAGHYYLAVQFDLEASYLQVLGFATHQQLRKQGMYDPLDRTYVLATADLTEDLTAMWVGREISNPVVNVNPSLASLSSSQAEAILDQIAEANFVIPRLEIPFTQWAALLSQVRWRGYLSAGKSEQVTETVSRFTPLKQWFQKEFTAGWEALESLLSADSMNLAMNFRDGQQTTHGLKVEGVKLIDLGVELGHQSIALLINLTQVAPEKIEVRVQLLPWGDQVYLPPGIELALLSSSEKVVQAVQGRTSDQLIQLKRFTCQVGKGFNLRITLDQFSWRETFVME